MTEKRVPLYQTIIDDIQSQIASKAFQYEIPICTEKSICDKYNTSRITAKHAINKLEERGILYRKRGLGSFVVMPALKPVAHQVFALVIPFGTTLGGVFRSIDAANQIITRLGHQLTIHISHANPKHNAVLLESLYSHNINGIVYYPLNISNLPVEILQKFAQDGRPVIILDKKTTQPEISTIHCDNFKGGYLLAEHLISYGHSNICYLSRFAPNELSSINDRYMGYCSCLEAANITPRFVRWNAESPTGYYMLQHLVNALRQDGVTAMVCENDKVAFNVHMCCLGLGMRIPEDMSITGFDNIEWAVTGSAQITTIDQNFDIIGKTIAETLLDENYTPQNRTTPVQIIPRTSTGVVAKNEPPPLSLQYALNAQNSY